MLRHGAPPHDSVYLAVTTACSLLWSAGHQSVECDVTLVQLVSSYFLHVPYNGIARHLAGISFLYSVVLSRLGVARVNLPVLPPRPVSSASPP